MDRRQLVRWELDGVAGAVVVIDVLRAFTTAAYAFGHGARAIYLVAGVDEALDFKAHHPGVLAMGEDHGLRPAGFDLSNSPVEIDAADLDGRTLVHRSSSGTQGIVEAAGATRLWAASLVCASATARAVTDAGLGDPTYVITGCFPDAPTTTGDDDRITADYIEAVRLGRRPDPDAAAVAVRDTLEARRTIALDPEHGGPLDVDFATDVDAFDFAMEVISDDLGLRLEPRPSGPC